MENITVNMENLSTEERAQLMALIEKANAPKSKVWEPKVCERYWFVFGDASISYEMWADDKNDNNRLSIGNCFKTETEAEFEVERLKVLRELSQFASIERNEHNQWYYLFCRTCNNAHVECGISDFNTGELHFKTKDDALAAIYEVGEDRIKKYYFCMEDENEK